MPIQSRIKKILLGIDLPREYLCIGKESLYAPLKISLTGAHPVEITDNHLFLGYKPLIIAITATQSGATYNLLAGKEMVSVECSRADISSKPIALLQLKYIESEYFDDKELFIYKGVEGKHRFLSSFHRLTNSIYSEFSGNNPDNIFLKGNLYEQVRIAYSLPRVISIISLGDEGRYNMFPTDLNGSIDENYYVVSLRRDGKANEQVSRLKKICISQVDTSYYKTAYAMGKNHMQPLKPEDPFSIDERRSDMLQLPLPSSVISYRELQLIRTLDIGIHHLHFCRILNSRIVAANTSTLSHVHAYYANWRKKNGFTESYLY